MNEEKRKQILKQAVEVARSGIVKIAADYLHEQAIETMMRTLQNKSAVATGRGQGQGNSRQGTAGTDTCRCPSCGATAPHQRGVPCNKVKCSKCGTPMTGTN